VTAGDFLKIGLRRFGTDTQVFFCALFLVVALVGVRRKKNRRERGNPREAGHVPGSPLARLTQAHTERGAAAERDLNSRRVGRPAEANKAWRALKLDVKATRRAACEPERARGGRPATSRRRARECLRANTRDAAGEPAERGGGAGIRIKSGSPLVGGARVGGAGGKAATERTVRGKQHKNVPA